MKNQLKVQVIETATQEVLLEVSLAEEERAYAYSLEMEKLGLEVEVRSPTLLTQLGHSLGRGQAEVDEFEASVMEELEEHEGREECLPQESAEVIK